MTGPGLGFERVRIQLDGESERATRKPAETISGSIVNGPTAHTTIAVNGVSRPLTIADGRFTIDVPLEPGANTVQIQAVDGEGRSAEATVSIKYTPPSTQGIAITAPADGMVLGQNDPPIVVVQGRVDDPSVASVTLLVNQTRFDVPVRNGTFQQPVPVLESAVTVIGEIQRSGATPQRTAPITVRAAASASESAVLFVEWNSPPTQERRVRAAWRGRADRADGRTVPVTVNAMAAVPGTSTGIFYVRGMRAGVYTFVADTGALPPTATLFVPVNGTMIARHLKPSPSSSGGSVTLAKLLLPFAVLWNQDEWFSGRSESSDTITKFNADGVTWVERRRDVP